MTFSYLCNCNLTFYKYILYKGQYKLDKKCSNKNPHLIAHTDTFLLFFLYFNEYLNLENKINAIIYLNNINITAIKIKNSINLKIVRRNLTYIKRKKYVGFALHEACNNYKK